MERCSTVKQFTQRKLEDRFIEKMCKNLKQENISQVYKYVASCLLKISAGRTHKWYAEIGLVRML